MLLETIEPALRTPSTARKTFCLMSTRSITASMIQSQSASSARSSSRLPGVMSFAREAAMSGDGLVFFSFSMAPIANELLPPGPSCAMSSSTTGMPAFATCAAMPAPITPEPRTPTF